MKKRFLKILSLFLLGWFMITNIGVFWANDFPYEISDTTNEWSTDFANMVNRDAIQNTDWALTQLLEVFQLSNQDWYGTDNQKALNYIKWILNMALSLTSLIALLLLVYVFYMMFFSEHEEGLKKAKAYLKWIAIALAILWLSWVIISYILYIQQSTAIA